VLSGIETILIHSFNFIILKKLCTINLFVIYNVELLTTYFSTEEDLKPFLDCQTSEPTYKDQDGEVWEKIVDKEHFKLWRCPVAGSSLYKYKGIYVCLNVNTILVIEMIL